MKKRTLFLSILVISILLTSCEKDENGIPVKYYKNVSGEGYAYYKYNDGTIMPYIHPDIFPYKTLVSILASEKQIDIDIDNYRHIDYVEVNNNGKFTCRFLEKKRPSVWAFGEWKKMSFYTIYVGDYKVTYTLETIQEAAKKATKNNPQIVNIDTIWININTVKL